MSGFFRAVGTVASAVATVAAFVPGGQPVAGIAAGIAAVAGTAAQLTAKPPRAQGSVQGFLTGANQTLPYLIGEAYTEGVELYKVGYGDEEDDVKNPYAFIPRVLSCCGPIESMGATLVNYESVTLTGTVGSVQEASGYYATWLYADQRLGARPEATALQTPSGWGTPTNWSSAHKLSSMAAIGWSLRWSKKAERFAGGQIPPLGKVPQGVKVYDPRLDSTVAGGSGSQRIDDETTWAYSANPALHHLTYGYGRLVNNVPVFGLRLFDAAALDIPGHIAWANVCDANGWTVNGTIYEPGDKWNNLKKIAEAGAAQPVPGAVLGVDYQAPRTSLYTVTLDDLAGPISAALGTSWASRKNVMVPRYRSSAHQWGHVQADEVRIAAFVTADGEEKFEERQWDLVTDADQVTELATYDLYQRREAGPIRVPCKPHMREFRRGNCLTLAAELGAHPDGAIKVVIRRKVFDPLSGTVEFICSGETDAKHTAALGLTGGAPATVTWPTQEELDAVVFSNTNPAGLTTQFILTSFITDADPADGVIQATDTAITIETHTRVYSDKSVSVTGATLTTDINGDAITAETKYFIYYDDATRAGGGVTFVASKSSNNVAASSTNPNRHYVGAITTDVLGGSGSSGGGSFPPGWQEDDYYYGDGVAP